MSLCLVSLCRMSWRWDPHSLLKTEAALALALVESIDCYEWTGGYPGSYSQHSAFFATYEWAQWARVLLHYNSLERLAREKYSTSLDPFVSYAGNNELWIWPQESIHEIMSVNSKDPQCHHITLNIMTFSWTTLLIKTTSSSKIDLKLPKESK